MAFPLSRRQYVEVGDEKNLNFLDNTPPATVYEKCNWNCKLCGKHYYKTYRAVYLGKFGCRCQNSMSMPVERYEQLAEELQILFVGVKPVNIFEPTTWYSPRTGKKVTATYHDLAGYNGRKIPDEI